MQLNWKGMYVKVITLSSYFQSLSHDAAIGKQIKLDNMYLNGHNFKTIC